MSLLLWLEWISSIIFIVAGIISTTKYCIKLKVKVGLEVSYLIANTLWFVWCWLNGDWGYIWVGILYTGLGIIGVANFSRIYKKAKKGKEYKLI